jgi:predicted O-methyltransferase YrrM
MKVSGQIDKLGNVYNEDSHKILMNLLKMNEKFDLIYVDGSHRCLDCYLDIEISFELLNKKGILIIDDVPYLKEQYEAVIHFLKRNEGKYKILKNTYRLFLEKIKI